MVDKPTYEELEERIRKQEETLSTYKETEKGIPFDNPLLDTAFEMSPFSMWISDNSGTILYTNRALRSTIKLDNEDIVGKYNVLKDQNLELSGVMPQVRSVFENHEPAKFNIFWQPELVGNVAFTGAREMHINVYMYPVLDEHKQLKNVVCQWIDTSDFKRTKKELEESEEKYRYLFDNMAEGAFYQNSDGEIVDYNQNALRMFGLTADQFLGRTSLDPAWRVIHSDGSPYPGEEHPSMVALKTGKPVLNKVAGVFNPDKGDYVWLQINAIPQFAEGAPKPYQVFVTMRDITEQKLTEDTLRESEEKYRKLVTTAPFGIQLTDLDGKILLSNPAHHRIHGHGENELVGTYIWDLIAEDEAKEFTKAYYLDLIKHQPVPETYYSKDRSKDGHLIDTQIDWDYIYNTDGELISIISIISDVTERKQSEKKIEDVRQFNERIILNSPVGISIYQSESGQCIATNDAMAKLVGATKAQVLSQNCYEISSWKESGVLQAALTALKENKKVSHVASLTTTFGKEVVIDCHLAPFEFAETPHLMLTATDITRRVTAEKAILAQKEKAEQYLNIAGVIFVALNNIGEVTLINRKGCEVIGYESTEIIGRNWFENFVPEWLRDDLIPVSKQLLSGDIEPVEYFENPILTKNGEERLIAWHNTILKDGAGNITGHLSAGHDITDKRQLEEQLQRAQKMESIGTLAGGIAHEFNNILSIIIGNNELIMEDLPDWSLSRESCEEIRLAGLRARDIVKHLLTFSRQDDSTKKPIDIASVTAGAVKLIRATTPSNFEIRDKISADCLPIIGDSTQIHQVLINLCNNAVDALPISGGRMEIELNNIVLKEKDHTSTSKQLPGTYVKLIMRDNGCGMDTTTLDRVFEPYFTTKEVGKGSGIGLAVVHGIIENHDGSITCESTPGEGTTFTILIPAYAGQLEEETDRSEIISGKGEKVLYVDDEPAIARLGKRHLDSLGYQTFSTTDPKEALDIIRADPDRFDLVITDMAMPDMPGDQLIAGIKSLAPNLPTIICSGYSSRMSEAKASKMGIKAFVMKPLNKTELSKKVREVLESSD
ncbi:MAG: PAS domain-containing sensor histidine kinase [Desulfobulbaceae bacterium]|nr:MAG: PAS domain-containing sensor histidine kinase [Desulfobulbaceae bacterium]